MDKPNPMEISPRLLKEKLDAGEPICLIDVREAQEYAICRIESGELIPMNTIPRVLPELREKAAAGPLVFYCHHGVRSLQTVAWLRHQGLAGCCSLQGGIDLWSVTVDPAVPRY